MQSRDPKRPLNMNDVALALGVAQSTVSRALRNDAQISKALRERIQAEAKRLGYRPNPYVSAFTAQVRSYRRSPTGATTAFLHCFPRNARDFAEPYSAGARERVEELGFTVEDFSLDEFEGSLRVLSKALWTRSIQGLLVLPVPPGFDLSEMNFESLAAVTVDPSLKKPVLHRATPDYFQGMRLALEVLAARGYSRVGFCSYQEEIDHIGARWMGAYQFWQSQHRGAKLHPLVIPDWKRSRFETWLRKERPDVIVSNDFVFCDWLRQLKIEIPGEVAFATLSAGPTRPTLSGIDQRPEDVGAAAADMVVGQIYRNEYGLPAVPKRVSVAGRWVDGETVAGVSTLEPGAEGE